MVRIAFLVRAGKPFDIVYTAQRGYLKHLKQAEINPEIAMIHYINYKYPWVQIDKFTINTMHKLKPKDYKAIFSPFLDVVMPALDILYKNKDTAKYNAFLKKLKTFSGKLYPRLSFINFITDKCKYHKWLDKNKFPIIEGTRCFRATSKPIKVPKNKEIFLKPVPGAGSKDLLHVDPDTTQRTVDNYFKRLANKGVKKIMVQDYKDFGSDDNPEYRTYWLSNDAIYQYTIETSAYGYDPKIKKGRLPVIVKMQSQRLVKALAKKFKTALYVIRVDWAKAAGRWFINEIEWAPGMFSDEFSSWDWRVDEKMADLIVKQIS